MNWNDDCNLLVHIMLKKYNQEWYPSENSVLHIEISVFYVRAACCSLLLAARFIIISDFFPLKIIKKMSLFYKLSVLSSDTKLAE